MSAIDEARDAAIRAELERYERSGEYLPGTADRLFNPVRLNLAGRSSPADIARVTATTLGTLLGRGLQNPEHVPAANQSELRRVLTRQADRLKGGAAAVDGLVAAWAADLRLCKGPELAARVADRLSDPANNAVLATPLPPPRHIARLAGVLGEHFGDTLANPETAAETWAKDFIGQPDDSIIRTVARRLTIPRFATEFTADGQPLAADDRRLNYRTPPKASTGDRLPGVSLL